MCFCILGILSSAAVLATFQKIGQFFPNHLVTLWQHQDTCSTEIVISELIPEIS
jgi:hypothetical protein